jgi:alkaline phosphatase D
MRSLRLRLGSSLVLLVVAALFAATSTAKLTVMHGYADYTSALLWVQAETSGPVEITWTAAEGAPEQRAAYTAIAVTDNVVLARLTGLTPGTVVRYAIVGDGERREGSLRTQPHWSKAADAADLTIAFGSCFFLADSDPRWGGQSYGGGFEIFDAIAAQKPDVMVWLGDNLYFQAQDELDPVAMAARYRRQRNFAPLASLLTSASQLAIWDDHDYGPNDADMSYVMKGEALKLFTRYWANPSYGLPDVPGIFGRARWGDVDIFLLDDRWYRSANGALDGPDKTMFGAQQLVWLKNALIHSTATIKLIATGSQMWNKANRFEGGNHFPTEQKAFAQWLVAQRIDGVIFLTGDRHFSELLKISRPAAPPLYEFTSSPLTSGPFDIKDVAERTNPDMIAGTFIANKRQFGMLRVTGPANDRHIALESHDSHGELLWRQELRARDLKFGKPAP